MGATEALTGAGEPSSRVTRRTALRTAGLLAGGLAVGGFARLASALTVAPTPRSAFEACVGSQLRLLEVAGVRALDVVKVRSLRAAQVDDDGASFSVLLRGAATNRLPQGVYTINDRRIGRMPVLMVPMRPEPTGQFYEVIFNRTAAS